MKHRTLSVTEVCEHGFIKLVKAEIEIDTYNRGKEIITRYGLVRPEVVAAVLYRPDTDQLVMIEQFRYSALRTGNGWIREIIAGVIEDGEDIDEAARRECLEESGYRVGKDFRKVLDFYPSVGLSDQIIHLYYGEVTEADKVTGGGGLPEEMEDIRVIETDSKEVFQKLSEGKYQDAKAVIGLYWFFQNIKK